MGVISKIREKSGIAVGIIALGLALFVVGDDFLRGFSVGSANEKVGEINGKSITLKDFTTVYNELYLAFRNQGNQEPNEQQGQSIKQQAWDQIVFEKVYLKEFEKLGIGLSKKEMEQMIKGDTLFVHQQIKSVPIFQDSVTKKFSKANVNAYLAAISTKPEFASQRSQWLEFEQNLYKDRLQKKYQNLFANATYITKAEAKREYEGQNSKINTKFLYIPYSSISDSLVKPTDEQLRAYMQKTPKKYKAPETRTLDYVLFTVAPSKSDSSAFVDDLRELAKKLATTTNDSAFVASYNRIAPDLSFKNPQQIPDGIYSENKPLIKGGIYGPFLNGDKYMIVKVVDVKEDSTAFVRSSHILFKATTPEEKADAKKRASEVLQKIKDGEDFAKMAKIHGSDGTASKGGDLGWYGKKAMVANFEVSTLSRTEAGLLNDLVETEFGYHIVKVTQGSTKKKYKLAMIEKQIFATDESIQDAYDKAITFQGGAKDYKSFLLKIKENPTLVKKTADKISFNTKNIEGVSQATEIIKWAFNEGEVGKVAEKPFKSEEQGKTVFIVPMITARTDKDELNLDFFRQQVDFEVRKEMKKEMIMKKIGETKGSVDDVAKKYGQGATVQTANDITMQNTTLGAAGFSPVAVGKAFGLKKGQNTGLLADESGILMVEVTDQVPAATISDYTQYKNTALNSQKQMAGFFIFQALSELYKIEDYRGKVKGL